jgi:hypothetical protein
MSRRASDRASISLVPVESLEYGIMDVLKITEHHSRDDEQRKHPLAPRNSRGGQTKYFLYGAPKNHTLGSPYFVWINTNAIISSWYLLDAVCV